MSLPLRILRTAAITLVVVIGLPVGLFFWTNAQWLRQDINVSTGEIREVREGVLFDSSPDNIHDTAVTPVLKKHGIGMPATENPWVFFNRVHAFAKMGGDYALEADLLTTEGRWSHIHYGHFLDAIAQYRSPEEAALWWKALLAQEVHWRRTQFNRAYGFRRILEIQEKPFASKAEFDAWYSRLMTNFHNEPSLTRCISLFTEIEALYLAKGAQVLVPEPPKKP